MAQVTTATKDDVVVDFCAIELTGSLHHNDESRLLVLLTHEGPEHISVNLQGHDLTPEPGHVVIKDWSEHAGLTSRLAAAGLVRSVHSVAVGPFFSTAYEVEVTL